MSWSTKQQPARYRHVVVVEQLPPMAWAAPHARPVGFPWQLLTLAKNVTGAAKELNSTYRDSEALLFGVYPYDGNFNSVPQQQPR